MNCHECKKPIHPDAKFCRSCGCPTGTLEEQVHKCLRDAHILHSWPEWATHHCPRCNNFIVAEVVGGNDNFSPIISFGKGGLGATAGSFLIAGALNTLTRSKQSLICPICKSDQLIPSEEFIKLLEAGEAKQAENRRELGIGCCIVAAIIGLLITVVAVQGCVEHFYGTAEQRDAARLYQANIDAAGGPEAARAAEEKRAVDQREAAELACAVKAAHEAARGSFYNAKSTVDGLEQSIRDLKWQKTCLVRLADNTGKDQQAKIRKEISLKEYKLKMAEAALVIAQRDMELLKQ